MSTIETHPLPPFIPPNAKVLILGSFPPPKLRWKMNFYYPNFNNDFWRIMGLVFFANQDKFIDKHNKTFIQDNIEDFLINYGIAISDTAYQIKRLHNNASDKFLEIITPMDIAAILEKLPNCTSIITTGEKATQILCETYATAPPKVGQSVDLIIHQKPIALYRLPSSSRAYPLRLEHKAESYRQAFAAIGLLSDMRC
ncbi:G/U mismatch-specific uracil-DNA glycosylase [Moraxella cuniculi DSM 21768]|uniref:G/U mismatch-specific uracil-DNA glycosylase n=1 Tax=Moraxella cuniculi DSM 21768 TaxID=1122245 RepID=A0A1N7FKY4_9GAMM|nr:uracil-DNA glycosylase family protein [Moraxella cuniculi]OOS05738.1 DNA glycosylase [Moraxella cuniculi]SIS01068.1 G/U mismatch-specific uracil-DNA glycosylase [Moraxella cuniculi DSM 21768]